MHIILHIDMDYFFAQIEERERPELKGKPVVVGADPKGGRGRGVVSTANYIARRFGMKSAMPISEAWRRCPEAIFLSLRGNLYGSVSRRIMEIIRNFVRPEEFEQVSIDEAYLDLSRCGSFERARKVGQKLKGTILEQERLTASVGIGANKLLAKIASDHGKPNGLTIIEPGAAIDFLAPLSVTALSGVGPKTAHRLGELGVQTIADLREVPIEELAEVCGSFAKTLAAEAWGIDERPIEPYHDPKSFGRQITFDQNTRDKSEIMETFIELANEVWRETRDHHVRFRTVTVTVRYADFKTITRAKTLDEPSQSFVTLKSVGLSLFLPCFLGTGKRLRLIGIRVSELSAGQERIKLSYFHGRENMIK